MLCRGRGHGSRPRATHTAALAYGTVSRTVTHSVPLEDDLPAWERQGADALMAPLQRCARQHDGQDRPLPGSRQAAAAGRFTEMPCR
jgi:hypothetical protein